MQLYIMSRVLLHVHVVSIINYKQRKCLSVSISLFLSFHHSMVQNSRGFRKYLTFLNAFARECLDQSYDALQYKYHYYNKALYNRNGVMLCILSPRSVYPHLAVTR